MLGISEHPIRSCPEWLLSLSQSWHVAAAHCGSLGTQGQVYHSSKSGAGNSARDNHLNHEERS
eukprot:759100-Hanusia_phi.AAC.2